MPWTPQIKTFDARHAAENLLAFFAANQRAALDWAGAAPNALASIRNFYNSARLVTSFPSLTVLQSAHRQRHDDLLLINFSITLETALISGDQDKLTRDARAYALAVESMMRNVPETTLFQNSIIELVGNLTELQTEFDVLQSRKNQFIQIFQTRGEWRLEASAY